VAEVPEPKTLSAEEVQEKLRPFTADEISAMVSAVKSVPVVKDEAERLESSLGAEGANEFYAYMTSKVPPVFSDYCTGIVGDLAKGAAQQEGPGEKFEQFTGSISGASTVSQAKSRLDEGIKRYLGVSSHSFVPVDALSMPITALSGGKSRLPYPPRRLGVPSTITTPSGDVVVDFVNPDAAYVQPKEGTVVGPRLHTDRAITFEVDYTSTGKGVCGTVALILYRILRFVRYLCGLAAYYERLWWPVMLHFDEIERGDVRKAFAFSPDYVNTLAIRIMPLGANIATCTLTKVL